MEILKNIKTTPCTKNKIDKERCISSIGWALLIVFSLILFGALAQRFPPVARSQAHSMMLATSANPRPSAAELLPTFSGNLGYTLHAGSGSYSGSFH